MRHLPKGPVAAKPTVEPEAPARVGKKGPAAPAIAAASANMPTPSANFAGLDFANWGAGHPPDTVGDVGTSFYVQAVNTSIGIFAKTGGAPLAAFTFNTLWSSAATGTPCDTNNNGDPTVVYDPMADRYIVADFAWTDVLNGPYYECIAVSKTGNPLTGGWWLYSVRADDATHPWLPDYPKMGIWPDGLYMTANMFDCLTASCSSATYKEVRAYAFNRSDLESGATLRSVVADLGSASYFSLLPSNLRGAAPPAGRENLLVSESGALFAWEVWKFHVDWAVPTNSTFTGPTNVSQTAYTTATPTVPSSGNNLDALEERLMMQNQYRNLGGSESLWVNHTVRTGSLTTSPNGIQWGQINVTGGTVSTTPVQQQIYGNVGGDGLHRWMGSLAVDGGGNMALGYSTSKAAVNPGIRYSGRLASDPLSTLAQGEATLQTGGGSQTGSCSSTCARWGDYSAMTVDPVDDCTFWYTNEYYAASGLDWQTRIGSFKFPNCGAATLSSIAVTPVTPTIANGTDQQFTATGTYSDATTADLTSLVTWASAIPAGATISAAGLAHAVGLGTSMISATLGLVGGNTLLTVLGEPVAVLTYTGATTAAPGRTVKLSATLTTASGTPLSKRTVTFTLNGNTYTGTTNKFGVASVRTKAPAATGPYPIAIAFAGDARYGPSSTTATLTVS